MTLVLSSTPARVFIQSCKDRYEVQVLSTYTDDAGVLVCRVRFVTSLTGHSFEVEASKIQVETTDELGTVHYLSLQEGLVITNQQSSREGVE